MKINLTALLVKSTHRYYKDTSMHTYLFREGWVGIGGVGPSSSPLIEEPPPLPNTYVMYYSMKGQMRFKGTLLGLMTNVGTKHVIGLSKHVTRVITTN